MRQDATWNQYSTRNISPGATDLILKQLHNSWGRDCATSGYYSNHCKQATSGYCSYQLHAGKKLALLAILKDLIAMLILNLKLIPFQ